MSFYEDSLKRSETMILDLSIELEKYKSRYEFLRDYKGDIESIWFKANTAHVSYDTMVDILRKNLNCAIRGG